MKRTALTIGLVIAWPLLTAGSCATGRAPEPVVITKTVTKAVAVSCVPGDFPQEPTYPDTDQALRTADGERFLALVLAGRDLRDAWLSKVRPVLNGCRSSGSP